VPEHLIDDAKNSIITTMDLRHAVAQRIGEQLAVEAKMDIVELAEVIPPSKLDCPDEHLCGLVLIIHVLRFGHQQWRILEAKVYSRGVLDLLHSCEPCPGRIAIVQAGEKREVIVWGHFEANPRSSQRIGGSPTR
jgi:hypothetical protein